MSRCFWEKCARQRVAATILMLDAQNRCLDENVRVRVKKR